MRAENVDALSPCSAVQIQYVSIACTCFGSAAPRHSSRKRVAAVDPLATSSGSTEVVAPSATRADWATTESIVAETRARSSRACSSEMSMSFCRSHSPERCAVDRLHVGGRVAREVTRGVGRGRLQAGLRVVVDEESPDLLERDAADEILDVDAPVAQCPAVAIGLCDLRLEGDDALEARLELAHGSPRSSAAVGGDAT